MSIEVNSFSGAMAALKHPHLAQALYDQGSRVMADALITLHGKQHAERRVVEYAIFNRRSFQQYESTTFPQTLGPILLPYLNVGRADLVELGYRVTMNLTADFAGIDRPNNNTEETETLLHLVRTFSAGATIAHNTGDTHTLNVAVDEAMDIFDSKFLQPSIARRMALIADGENLPDDVLSLLLINQHKLKLRPDVLRREMSFYLQAGAHSTANATTHALHDIFDWMGNDAEGQHTLRHTLLNNKDQLQRAVHESLRLHPASPIALRRAIQDTEFEGQAISAGTEITVNLVQANQDPTVFGDDAQLFNPHRQLPGNVWPFGLTFGYGAHSCMGRALDGGTIPRKSQPLQIGIVSLLVHTLLNHNAKPIAQDPAKTDEQTSRANWGYYPVSLSLQPIYND